jgi:hypothetical protein
VNFDVLFLRQHTIQRVLAAVAALGGNAKYSDLQLNTAIANGAGTAINPGLLLAGVAAVPDMCIPIPKALPGAVTRQSFVATVLAAGAITIQHAEGAPVNHDVYMMQWISFQRLLLAVFTSGGDTRRYFSIADAVAATAGAVYADQADATRQFTITVTKVALSGVVNLFTRQTAGTSPTAAAGNLTLVSGTGDAIIAFTQATFEKLIDLRQDTPVANGAGLVFNPRLFENGVEIRPDIVIPIPKAINTVPFVPTDLTTAPGNVTIQHNAGGPINHDILSIRLHSIFRDIA